MRNSLLANSKDENDVKSNKRAKEESSDSQYNQWFLQEAEYIRISCYSHEEAEMTFMIVLFGPFCLLLLDRFFVNAL